MSDDTEVQKETHEINGISMSEAWSKRRAMIFKVTFVILATILWFITIESPTTLQVTSAETLLATLTLILMGWIFGGVLDDTNRLEKKLNGIPLKEAWVMRRRVIYIVLLYVLVVCGYLFMVDKPTVLQERIATSLIELSGWLLIGWIYGSVMDDTNWMKDTLKNKLKFPRS